MVLKKKLSNVLELQVDRKSDFLHHIKNVIDESRYTIIEENDSKPWGGYFRLDSGQADEFIAEFFPGLSTAEARLNIPDAELSPKFLNVSTAQRLSWQYHDRRAERWAFLTDGAYYKSNSDNAGELIVAKAGDVVQFAQGERHRLVGAPEAYTVVAEIWQHIDPSYPSNEDDITRLSDDYSR